MGRYDRATIWFHWVTVLLVLTIWGLAQATSFLPRGPARHNIWSVHVLLGVILLLVLAGRIAWRMSKGHVLPGSGNAIFTLLAKSLHRLLYVLLAVVVLLGVANTWARGWDFFGLLEVPAYDPTDTKKTVAHMLNGWHDIGANSIMALASVHAATALFRHYVLLDGTLRRMVTGTAQNQAAGR
jgi:cytochrome b561